MDWDVLKNRIHNEDGEEQRVGLKRMELGRKLEMEGVMVEVEYD